MGRGFKEGTEKPSGLSEPFQEGGGEMKDPRGRPGGPGHDPRGMRLRPLCKEMPSSECHAGEGKGPRPPGVLSRVLLGLGSALWASRAVCWEARPAHCLANE